MKTLSVTQHMFSCLGCCQPLFSFFILFLFCWLREGKFAELYLRSYENEKIFFQTSTYFHGCDKLMLKTAVKKIHYTFRTEWPIWVK